MSSLALTRGRGPVYADLPPTLLPHAIAASAPPADRLRTAVLSSLIYLAIAGGTIAVSSLAAPEIIDSVLPPKGEPIVSFDSLPTVPRPSPQPPAPPARNTRPEGEMQARVITPTDDPTEPAPGLPTEDHSGDIPAGPYAPNAIPNLGPGPGFGPGGSQPGTVHDVSMVGLAVSHRVDPVYPLMARKANIQGTVVLMMTVDERGQPIQVQVLEGHAGLHHAATEAAKQWRFEPARLEGQPVRARFRLTLNFRLK